MNEALQVLAGVFFTLLFISILSYHTWKHIADYFYWKKQLKRKMK